MSHQFFSFGCDLYEYMVCLIINAYMVHKLDIMNGDKQLCSVNVIDRDKCDSWEQQHNLN